VATDTAAAAVELTTIQTVPDIARLGFFGVTSLTFGNPTAGEHSAVGVSLVFLAASLFAGDVITVTLPEFSGNRSAFALDAGVTVPAGAIVAGT
jgi:hypothetical protein